MTCGKWEKEIQKKASFCESTFCQLQQGEVRRVLCVEIGTEWSEKLQIKKKKKLSARGTEYCENLFLRRPQDGKTTIY